MSKTVKTTLNAICPSCDFHIRFYERPKLRDVIVCPECEESFEVVRLSPLRLDWTDFEDDDFWPDDDLDEFDDRDNGQSSRY
jgi:lysine biosynthesis protein LysW